MRAILTQNYYVLSAKYLIRTQQPTKTIFTLHELKILPRMTKTNAKHNKTSYVRINPQSISRPKQHEI